MPPPLFVFVQRGIETRDQEVVFSWQILSSSNTSTLPATPGTCYGVFAFFMRPSAAVAISSALLANPSAPVFKVKW